MRSEKSTGRVVGFLMFAQLVGLTLPFIMIMPLSMSPDWLANSAAYSSQVRIAVLLFFAIGLLSIGIAIAAFPVIREFSERMALWLVAISIIWFAMQAVDNAHILGMLSMSERFAGTGGENREIYELLAATARSTRRWVHYSTLLVIDFWFAMFYAILFRFRQVPKLLGALILLAVILHASGIVLPVLLGYSSIMVLGYALAVSHLTAGAWLIWKGFAARTP